MEKIIIKFGDIEIEKQKFHQHKKPVSINNIDINKIVVSNKVSFGRTGFKYFIGYKDALCIFLSKINAYRRDFDEIKYMSFLIKKDEILEKCNEIWEKISKSIKKVFDSEPIYIMKNI